MERSINNSHLGMARKLTKSREITSVTSEIPPDLGPRFLLLLFSISAAEQEIVKRNEEKQVLPNWGDESQTWKESKRSMKDDLKRN